jgi:8-oxo-dGTP diphosphatase
MSIKCKEVVVVLPYCTTNKSVLMQLRDDNPDIEAPGVWGFFGGLIHANENPTDAAIRELEEEVDYKAKDIYHLNSGVITDLHNIYAHAFTVSLTATIDSLSLREGRDFKQVHFHEVLDAIIYSDKFGCFFPLVKTYYIKHCFTQTLEFWKDK